MSTITCEGIPITAETSIDIEKVISTNQFKNWLTSVDRGQFKIKSIHIQSVDMFGPKVGFIKFSADVVDKNGNFVPGILFMRGGSVGILPVFVCEGKEYTVLTIQPRLATGSFGFREIPAGMLDGAGNFGGVAAKELQQELELTISSDELTSLSELAGQSEGFFASPGGSDETIRLFAFKRVVKPEWLAAMNGKCTGVLEEGEQITLQIVSLDTLDHIPDGKTIVAYALYKLYGELIPLPGDADETSSATKASEAGQ